jgi:hypothetical protein
MTRSRRVPMMGPTRCRSTPDRERRRTPVNVADGRTARGFRRLPDPWSAVGRARRVAAQLPSGTGEANANALRWGLGACLGFVFLAVALVGRGLHARTSESVR